MTGTERKLSAAERKWIRRRRRWTNRAVLGTLLGGLAAGTWAFEATATATGLKGLLPEAVPQELTAEALEPLGPNWAAWAQETAAEVQAFYKADGDAAAQREQLAGLKKRLATIDTALRDARYSRIHSTLLNIRGTLARRVAVAEAVLDTLAADPQLARTEKITAKAQAVTAALAALESSLKSVNGGSAWLGFLEADALQKALKESADASGAVEALKATAAKLARRNSLEDAAQKAFLSRPAFVALETAINEQLAAIAAPVPTVDLDALRSELAKLIAALEDYEAAGSVESSSAARAAWKKVRELAADRGSRLEPVLASQYFNFNLRIVASEAFLSKLLADSRTESDQVRDFVLGANVGGRQTTTTNVTVDLKPSNNRVVFDLVLNGTVVSNTAGTTSQATIYTYGHHNFTARKEIQFDGKSFQTAPGAISVVARNIPTGAATQYSGGLFGRMAERIAIQEANNRRGASEAIARSRISDRVLPRFNREADESFAKASQKIDSELNAGLKATGLYPDSQHYQSTDNSLRISTRLMADAELGGSALEPMLLPEAAGATLALHESLVNNTIDRIGLNGKVMSEEELRQHVESFLSKALSREFKFSAPRQAASADDEDAEEKVPSKLVFAERDALRVQFRDGLLLLTIRAGLRREGKEPIPMQEITAPIRFTLEGDQIRASRERLDIVGIEGNLSPVQRKVMNSKLAAALPDRLVSATVDFTGPNDRKVQSKVNRIQMADGWISVTVQ